MGSDRRDRIRHFLLGDTVSALGVICSCRCSGCVDHPEHLAKTPRTAGYAQQGISRQTAPGQPLEVKHAIPKLKQDGWGIDDSLRQFFHDFDWFGVIANDWDPIKESPWRLQELENTELHTLSYDSPRYGRQYHIFYNAEHVGLLEITTYIKYTPASPRKTTKIGIGDALRPRVDFVQRSDDGGKSTKSIAADKRENARPPFCQLGKRAVFVHLIPQSPKPRQRLFQSGSVLHSLPR
jgi:hypothetical protein